MIRWVIGLIMALALAAGPGVARAQMQMTEQERSVFDCGVVVGMAIDAVYKQEPFPVDISAHVDTLYNYLYVNPVELKTSLKYLGKLHLQAFFALSADARLDYKEIERCIATTGKLDSFYSLPFVICAYYYSLWAEENGLRDKALAACLYGMKAHDKVFADKATPMGQLMTLLQFEIYFDRKDWPHAVLYAKKILDQDPENYFENLNAYAFCASMAGYNAEAREAYDKLIANSKSDDAALVELLLSNADLFAKERDRQNELYCLAKADSIASSGQNQEAYLRAKQALMSHYVGRKSNQNALTVLNQVIDHFEKSKNVAIADVAQWIPYCSHPYAANANKRFQKIVSKSACANAIVKEACNGMLYAYSGNIAKTLQCKNKISSYADNDPLLIEALPSVIQFFLAIYDFDNAIKYAYIELDEIKNTAGTEHELYTEMLLSIAEVYALKKDYLSVNKIYDEVMAQPGVQEDIKKRIAAEKAQNLTFIGDFDKSSAMLDTLLAQQQDDAFVLELYDTYIMNLIGDLDIMLNDSFENKEQYAQTTARLLDVSHRAVDLAQKLYGEADFETLFRIKNLCAAYYFNNDIDKMRELAKSWQALVQQNITNADLRDTFLEAAAFFLSEAGDNQAAYNLLHGMKGSTADALFPDESTSSLYAKVLYALGKKDEARSYMSKSIGVVLGKVANGMATLTSRERMYYWRMYQHVLANAAQLIDDESASPFVGDVYNLALFSKGLLLTSDLNFVNAVKKTGDNSLLEQLELMRNLRENSIQSTQLADDERQALLQRAEEIEKNLLAAVSVDQAKSDILWQDVAKRLAHDAVAIELIEYQQEDHTPMYGALLLRNESKHPLFINLGKKAEIEKSLADGWQDGAAASIWQSMLKHVPDVKTIYFAPTGIFHSIPLESAPNLPNGDFLADKDIYRLSSTRELTIDHPQRLANAVVMGNIDYNASAVGTSMPVVDEPDQTAELSRGKSITLKRLPYAKKEVDSIAAALTAKQINVLTLQESEVTEWSLRQLSGQDIDILHIATHGAYFGKSQSTNNAIAQLALPQTMNAEDVSLTKNLLYFAGANNSINGQYHGDYCNDGIINSLDISNLDFSTVDLVTLSACQSGLGEVSADGIFGLQRGFKKAGAKSIVMSLWSVDDKATMLLMTEFYKHLAAGRSKHWALEKAKQFVRTDGEHSDPKYWAAFVLLDGVE